MFSTALKFTPSSHLYRRMPLLQHIVALSVVSAIRTIPGYEVGCTIAVHEHMVYMCSGSIYSITYFNHIAAFKVLYC